MCVYVCVCVIQFSWDIHKLENDFIVVRKTFYSIITNLFAIQLDFVLRALIIHYLYLEYEMNMKSGSSMRIKFQ